MSISDGCDDDLQTFVTPEIVSDATKRCALIHAVYRVVAEGGEYSDLVHESIESEAFEHMIHSTRCQTWGLFREEFAFARDVNCPRFGKGGTIRSESKEQRAITALKPLLKDFAGKVDLKKPQCPIYLLEGLRDDILSTEEGDELYKILAVQLESGAKHSVMAPNTRICKSTTPLDSTTAHMLCNIAMIRSNETILDPFAGSAATLLAASLIASDTQTVGIEVASNEVLSRESIRQDFVSRGLTPPLAVLEGDAMNESTRDDARRLIGGKAFDVIITDPPYGRREGMSKFEGMPALSHLIDAICHDRLSGKLLLKRGGRMVAFQPCRKGQNIFDLLPSPTQLEGAGLQLQAVREQRLSTGLSRWVLSFLSI